MFVIEMGWFVMSSFLEDEVFEAIESDKIVEDYPDDHVGIVVCLWENS